MGNFRDTYVITENANKTKNEYIRESTANMSYLR